MKKLLVYIILILFCSGLSYVRAQVPTPAGPQTEAILLTNGVAHIGNGQVINDAIVGFDRGKITVVGNASTNVDRGQYRVIDLQGQHIYPGFILINSRVGLQEVSSVNAMSDNSETGGLNPNVRAQPAYNTDSEFPPTFRFNGILLAESAPSGGIISGTSSVMNMEGWNWEDATHTADVGIHLNWPSRMRRQFDFSTFTVSFQPNKNYDRDVRNMHAHFADAVSYGQLENKPANLKMEAMQGLFDGSQTLFIHVNSPKEMVEAVKFAEANGVKRITIVGSTEAVKVAEFLKEHNVGVVLPPVHSLPSRPDQDYDMPFKTAHLLSEAGVKVALSHSGMLSQSRNLPFYAGTTVAYGMDKEEALKTISLNPAEMLGIADKVGTLEVGKDASLFVSIGDALDIRTNQLSHAFIQGREVTLDNKQQMLYKRFSEKYGHDIED